MAMRAKLGQAVSRVGDKRNFCLVLLSVLVIPWWRGGREAAAILIGLIVSGLGLFLVSRVEGLSALGRRGAVFWGLAFVGWMALSLSWSVNRYQTIRQLIIWVAAMAVFALAYALRDKYMAWIKAFITSSTIFSLIGAWFYAAGGYERLTSTFYWANPFAAWLLPAVILAWWMWLRDGRPAALLAVAINSAAFVLTDSRSAAVVLVAMAAVSLPAVRPSQQLVKRIFVAIVLAVVMVAGLNAWRQRGGQQTTSLPGARFAEAVSGESKSGQDRVYFLRSAWMIWQDHPWIGTGAGTYGSVHPKYQLRPESASAHAHNFYAQTAAELGLVGAIVLAGLVATVASGALRGWRTGSQPWALVVALASLVVHFGLDIDSAYPVLVWLAASLAGLLYRPPDNLTAAFARYPAWTIGGLILLVLPAVSIYRSELAAARAAVAQSGGEYKAAAEGYHAARTGLAYNPDYVTAEGINYYVLARLGENKGENLALGLDRASQAIKLDAGDAQHHLLAARIMLEQQNLEEAARHYSLALQKDPYNEPDYYSELAGVEIERGHYEVALEQVDRGISLYPDTVIARREADADLSRRVARMYVARAAVYRHLGQAESMRQDAVKALELDPDNIPAKQILAL
jgi:O-antigen ligase